MHTSRRRTLRSLAGLVGTGLLVGCSEQSTSPATETESEDPAATTAAASPASGLLADYLGEVPNYDGTVQDYRGESTVRVQVGVELGYGPFGFGPPAIHVDPGTTIQWEWTGDGGDHNVVEKTGAFDSGALVSSEGVNYEYTIEEPGVYEYYCEPHRTSEMKGAVVVGAVGTDG